MFGAGRAAGIGGVVGAAGMFKSDRGERIGGKWPGGREAAAVLKCAQVSGLPF